MTPKIHLDHINIEDLDEGIKISLGEDIDKPEFTYNLSWDDMTHWWQQYLALEKCKDAFAYRLKKRPVIKPGEDPF